MTLRHIRIFLAVCACGYNTTKAAQSLRMTQPAVSLAIRELEQYYGVALFDRLGRRLSITPVGQRFQSYAGHIASLFDEMELGLRNSGQLGTLRVGASITIGAQFLPGYVKSFSALCPEAEVRVRVEPTDQLERRLTDNTLDLALVEGIPRSPVLHAEAYMEDHLAVICPAKGAFSQGQRLTLDQFRRQPFLLISHNIFPHQQRFRRRRTLLRRFIMETTEIRRRIPRAGRLHFTGIFQVFPNIVNRIFGKCSHTGEIAACGFAHHTDLFRIDMISSRMCSQITDCRLNILQLRRKLSLIARTVLHRRYNKPFPRQSGKICQMRGFVHTLPCAPADPYNTRIILCAVLRINQVHFQILPCMSKPRIHLCESKIGCHRILWFSYLYLNCFPHC